MIDGLKFILLYNLEWLRNHPLLDFQINVSKTTGNIPIGKYPVAEYRGMKFIDRGSHIEVRGSIHVYNNYGKHNWNDFGLKELQLIIKEFCTTFNLVPSALILNNLEFGVNVFLPFEVSSFLDSVIMYKGGRFSHIITPNQDYRESVHSHFIIKIYDKWLQNRKVGWLMRFEIKFRKMERPNSLGIKYLSDLLDEEKLTVLSKELLRFYNGLYIGDVTFNPNNLTEDERELFFRGHQYSYWENEKQKVKELTITRKEYELKLEQFKILLLSTGANQKKLVAGKIIQSKIEQLLGTSSIQNSFSPLIFGETDRPHEEIQGKLTGVSTMPFGETDRVIMEKLTGDKILQKRETDTLLYNVRNGQSIKFCKVTGLDISMQKDSSLVLGATGIKYYRDHFPGIWAELQEQFSSRFKSIDEEIQEIEFLIQIDYCKQLKKRKKLNKHSSQIKKREFIMKDKLAILCN